MKQRKRGKRIWIYVLLIAGILGGVGCAGKERDTLEKIKDLDFTVITEENAPKELLDITEEKKEEGFKLTFQDNGFLYICRGYGKQETGGCSITVDALYETENAIYFDTTLVGPTPGEDEGKRKSPSYPYVIIKTELVDKPVVFE